MNKPRNSGSMGEWPDGVGMIYLAMSPWEGMWRNRHQLMSRFASDIPVLYVDPWQKLRRLRRAILSGTWSRSNGPNSAATTPVAGLKIFRSPDYLPVSGSNVLAAFTQGRWFRAVRRAALKIGICHPILWVSRPEMYRAVGRFGEILSIYHVVDEYGGYTGVDERFRKQLKEQEMLMLDKVDLTIAVSPELVRAKAGPNREIVLVENAVDPNDYEYSRNNGQQPSDLAPIPHPRLGYSGLIGKRLNLKLLQDIARQRPHWSIVMIGKTDRRECELPLSELSELPNVYFLGEKEPEDVSAYISGLDIGLLPYSINLETTFISPIKMYEYWAAGKPVVSTDIPAARRNNSAVLVARNTIEFIELCDRALSGREGPRKTALINLAQQNSWDARVEKIAGELMARINRNPG